MSKWKEAILRANDEFADISEKEIQDRIDARLDGLKNYIVSQYEVLKEIKELNEEFKSLPRRVRRQSKMKKDNEELLKQADKVIANIRFYEKVLNEAIKKREEQQAESSEG